MEKSSKAWTLYIILTQKGRYYTGISTDIKRRFEEHKSGKGAKFFRSDSPQRIVYTEVCKDHSDALKRENAIKKMKAYEKKIFLKEIKNKKP